MSDRLRARSEVTKLARLLMTGEDELAFLRELAPGDLRRFRELATERLFESSSGALGRAGAAAKLVPSGVAATVAQHAFGPLLCARVAAGVDAPKAIDVATRLPPAFLADVAVELDPRRVASIIARVPDDLVVAVARVLGERGDAVTMGRFLGFVPDRAIAAAIDVLDDEVLLRTGFVLEDKDRLDDAIALLDPGRIPGLLQTASRLGLWPEALDLLEEVSDARRGPIADIVAEQDADVIGVLVSAVAEGDLWESLLPVVGTMSPEARLRLAGMTAFHDPEVLAAIVRAAAAGKLWVDLVPLVDALPEPVLARVGVAASALAPDLLRSVVLSAAAAPDTLPTLAAIFERMDEAGRARTVGMVEGVDPGPARDALLAYVAGGSGQPELA